MTRLLNSCSMSGQSCRMDSSAELVKAKTSTKSVATTVMVRLRPSRHEYSPKYIPGRRMPILRYAWDPLPIRDTASIIS
eukprot:scaffold562683_cov42-Prasinocladus_malaysianus.AAC.1